MADTRPRSVHHSRVRATPSPTTRHLEAADAIASVAPGSFEDLGVSKALIACLTAQGILEPFPIQTATMRDALAGRDVLGRGKTGSGKTLAFVLPMLERLSKSKSHRRPGLPGRPPSPGSSASTRSTRPFSPSRARPSTAKQAC